MNRPTENQPFFQAAAAGRSAWWRYALSLLLIIGLTVSGGVCLTVPLVLLSRTAELAGMDPLLLTGVNLFTFAFVIIGLWIALAALHRRSMRSILSPAGPFRWKALLLSGGLWLAVSVLSDGLLAILQPGNYRLTYDPVQFWKYLPVLALLLPIQISAEELLFRGYLTQAIGHGTRSWALGWVLPAVAFGLLHSFNPEVGLYGFWLTMPLYIGLGLLLGWVTLRTQGLEMALGLHLANNLYASLAVTMTGSALATPALFTIQTYRPLVGLVVFALSAGAYALAVRRLTHSGPG